MATALWSGSGVLNGRAALALPAGRVGAPAARGVTAPRDAAGRAPERARAAAAGSSRGAAAACLRAGVRSSGSVAGPSGRRSSAAPARAAAGGSEAPGGDSGSWGPFPSPPPPPHASGPARVALVGAGPGDLELLTLRALRALREADVVLHDRLVSPEVLALVRPGASLVAVGKKCGCRGPLQEEINARLVAEARALPRSRLVVRLKGGDPFVFGRGGEEAAACRAAGVAVSVVPGVTAAAGVAAELSLPLTHRGAATALRLATGHVRSGPAGQAAELDAGLRAAAADADATLCIYMALGALRELSAILEAAGRDPRTPACAVSRGTSDRQRAVFAPLRGLAAEVRRAGLESPTLVLVGPVVALAPAWQRGGQDGVVVEGRGDGVRAWGAGETQGAVGAPWRGIDDIVDALRGRGEEADETLKDARGCGDGDEEQGRGDGVPAPEAREAALAL